MIVYCLIKVSRHRERYVRYGVKLGYLQLNDTSPPPKQLPDSEIETVFHTLRKSEGVSIHRDATVVESPLCLVSIIASDAGIPHHCPWHTYIYIAVCVQAGKYVHSYRFKSDIRLSRRRQLDNMKEKIERKT